MGQGWVKNDKNSYFHTSHLIPNSAFPKKQVLKSHNLLTQRKLKDKLTALHKTLQMFTFSLKLIAS